MPSYKLIYSNHKGLAEKCRLMFALAGQTFEDKRLASEEIKSMREAGAFPIRQVPCLEIDGTMYCESFAIATYLAREFGFGGKTSIEELQIGMVKGVVLDIYRGMYKWYQEQDADKKAAVAKNNNETLYPDSIGHFETYLKKNGTGFFVGDSITLADVLVFDTLEKVKAGVDMSKFPLVEANIQKVESNPNIAKWLKERPVTEM